MPGSGPDKMAAPPLDCVIVGYNDVHFASMLQHVERMQRVSGAYRNLLNNTLVLNGRRIAYLEALNGALTAATGRPHALHVGHAPNLGVCYLHSYLRRHGCEVESVNFFNAGRDELASLLEAGVRVVAITTTFYVDPAPIREIVDFVRARGDATIVAGGPHIFDICRGDEQTRAYQLDAIGADLYIYDSQGEATLTRVVTALRGSGDLTGIPNLVIPEQTTGDGTRRYHLTPPVPEANSMDENVVDWSLLPRSRYTPMAQMRTARSCAYKCSFCKYPVVAGPLSLTSIAAVEREMRQLREAGVRQLVFVDDTFNVPVRRFKELLRMMIANRFEFQWFSFLRCGEADVEAFDLMRESGCAGVFLGIESGDNSVLRVMNKHAQAEQYRTGIRALKERGIMSFASFIVGFPGENAETIRRTRDFIMETAPTFYRAEIYYHSDLVPIHRRADEFQLRGGGYSWRHRDMDWRGASDWVDELYRSITGPIIFPLYMFDFWSIPYLVGQGVSIARVAEFAALAQPFLVSGRDLAAPSEGVDATSGWEQLTAWGRRVADEMGATAWTIC